MTPSVLVRIQSGQPMKTLFDFQADNPAQIGGEKTLSRRDVAELNAGTARVFALMSDGQWHTREEICAACQQVEGLRRLRELRRGYTIEKQRTTAARAWRYRLVKNA